MADEDVEMIPVTSSQIKEVGYDADKKELRIRFLHNDALYSYSGVEQSVFDNLVNAASVGSTFGATVKGVYSYKRLS